MADLEDEIRELRAQNEDFKEKNSELAQEVQNLKMCLAERDKEKLDLMKELNLLRLRWSRWRSSSEAEAQKLDTGLQGASEEVLNHLVQASGVVARGIGIIKQYMKNREQMHSEMSRLSSLSGTPQNSDSKVNKVPPMSIGGQSIQPVVSLRRTFLNNNTRSRPNQNTNVTVRALPLHMLQDAYIPLARINLADMQLNSDNNIDSSADDLELPEEQSEESQNNITDDMDDTRRLDAVIEESEPDPEEEQQGRAENTSARAESPLEDRSWLDQHQGAEDTQRSGNTLEPDSTTPCDQPDDYAEQENQPLSVTLAFTPTVRRRRASPPRAPAPAPPSPSQRHSGATTSNCNRILKVVVEKMRFLDERRVSPQNVPKVNVSQPKVAQRRSTIDSPMFAPRSSLTPKRRPSEAAMPRDRSRAKLPKTSPESDVPSPQGSTSAHVVVVTENFGQKPVKQLKRIVYSDSDESEIDGNVGDDNRANDNMDVTDDADCSDNDMNVRNDNSEVNENNVRAQNSGQQRNTQSIDRNVSDNDNVNGREGRDGSDSDDDVIIVEEHLTTERDVSDQNDHVTDGENSEKVAFRGFPKERREDRPKLNVNNVTNTRDANVHSSRDKKASVAKRNTSEGRETNVTSVAEANISGKRNRRSATKPKRYASDRQDGDVSESSCQGVNSDTSDSDFEPGRGRSRRNKKKVSYAEVPLNRKMRR